LKTVVKVEHLSKQYRLGQVGTGTLSHDLNRWWHRLRGKEDPYLKVGETNDRSAKGQSEYVWALKDINFEVKEGEVLGIIGKNGAGKSTLLKILSKVTAPTTGAIKARGRIASLLEVGTGFHPELTGRENIYLNGTILGMTRAEVSAKLDEIVAFAGIERYLDTPVKRYSSGMKVRLGFAVAAHLEPEILIVDEVLAVGDAEFQKKAIGKMQEVSQGQGRTVLFVSHNMGSVQALCERAVLLENGRVVANESAEKVITRYLSNEKICRGLLKNLPLNSKVAIKKFLISPVRLETHADLIYNLEINFQSDSVITGMAILIYNNSQQRVGIIDLRHSRLKTDYNGLLQLKGQIRKNPLVEGVYTAGLFINSNLVRGNYNNLVEFEIVASIGDYIPYPKHVRGLIEFDHQLVD